MAPTRLLLQFLLLLAIAAISFHAGCVNRSGGTLTLDKPTSYADGQPQPHDFMWPPRPIDRSDAQAVDQQRSKNSHNSGIDSDSSSSSSSGSRNSFSGDVNRKVAISADLPAPSAANSVRRLQRDTLVVYVFSDTDPEYIRNLRYFVSNGIWDEDGCQYIIVIQQSKTLPAYELPELPANARYMQHANECYDWGTFGWVLDQVGSAADEYTYFVFLNSSVRGPFLPPVWPKGRHWSRAFTERITDQVKLVGPTISCEGSPKSASTNSAFRRNPHAQSYLLATDQVGLQVLKDDGRIFKCHHDRLDTIWHAELGSSKAILKAGYNLDCLMLRYQGVDWRDQINWQCNGGNNPFTEFQNDGLSVHPLETLFIKMKAHHLDLGTTAQLDALTLQNWVEDAAKLGRPSPLGVGASTSAKELRELRQPRTLAMAQRATTGACFDAQYYINHNENLPRRYKASHKDTMRHFAEHGQWAEFIRYRFTCAQMWPSRVSRMVSDSVTGSVLLRRRHSTKLH